MAKVTIPNTIQKFNAIDKDLSTTIATGLWKKAAQLLEYLNKSHPVGMIIWFRATQDLLPEMPDSKYWQEFDGSAVTNPLSPYFGLTLPNLSGRYFKHPSDLETVHTFGGSDTKNLNHDHDGNTGFTNPRGPFNGDNNNDRPGPYNHRHTIDDALSSAQDIKPLFRDLRIFLRIV